MGRKEREEAQRTQRVYKSLCELCASPRSLRPIIYSILKIPGKEKFRKGKSKIGKVKAAGSLRINQNQLAQLFIIFILIT
jgi:hypothetical protein